MDSAKIDTEFGETLIGGTLHRLLGFFRSAVSATKMSSYSKQLDRLLASMVMTKVIEDATGEKSTEDGNEATDVNSSVQETKNGVEKIVSSQILLEAGKIYLEGDKEKAKEKVDDIPDKTILLLPKSMQEMCAIIKSYKMDGDRNNNNEEGEGEEGEEGESNDSNELSEVENGENSKELTEVDSENNTQSGNNQDQNQGQSKGSTGDNSGEFKELGDGKKGGESTNDTIKIGDGSSNKIQEVQEIIKKYEDSYSKAITFCKKCNLSNNIKIKKVLNRIRGGIDTIKNNLADNRLENVDSVIAETKSFFEMVYKLCNNCETPKGSSVSEKLMLLESISLIIENNDEEEEEGNGGDRSTSGNLTQRQFNRVRKDIEKESKNWKVSKEDLKKINDVAESKKVKVTEITAREGKELIAILTKAKNALIHTKPYDEIRKNQKRWYDKLDGGGRAVNRKGYQSWVQKVTEIVSYYKEQVPDKVIVVITDSLDKTNISNDYVTLTQEFLGINARGKKPSDEYRNYNNRNDDGVNDNNYVTNYKVGDIIEYQKSKGGINTGEVTEIRQKDIDVKTKTGTFTILKTRVKEVQKKTK